MSRVDINKKRMVDKRVSFDTDWSRQCDKENNIRKQSRKTTKVGETYRDQRSESYPGEPLPSRESSFRTLSDSDSTRTSSRRRPQRALRSTKSDADLLTKDYQTRIESRSYWDLLGRKISQGDIGKPVIRANWDFLHGKLQLVGVLRKAMTKEALAETRKQLFAQNKQKTAEARLRLFRLAGKMTIYCIRLMNMHSLRNRENDDEVSPFIKGLHFRDYDAHIELLFDPSKFKANKSMRLSDDIKKILSKESKDRNAQDIYSAQIAFRNIKSIAEYPARMQQKIAEVGVYERYEAKRIIVRQGHPPSAFYFILSGDVVVMKMDESNTYARPVLHLARGDSFGELGIIQGTKRKATIICREATELLSISKKDYHDIFMLGGVKSIEDPDQDHFLRSLSFLKGWPVDMLRENGDKMMFHFYKRDDIIAKDTHYFDWIIVVKSGSISILKKLKKVSPFEWKNKDKSEFISEKQKKEIAEQKDINRRLALTELNIPTRNVEMEDKLLEEYPGKYKIFRHPRTEEELTQLNSNQIGFISDVPSARSSFSFSDIKGSKKQSRSSFQSIQNQFLPSVSEESRSSSIDYTYLTRKNKIEVGSGNLLHDKDSRRKESIIELEKEMLGFQEEKLTFRDDIDTGIKRKDPDSVTEADLKPEFVVIQTLVKGQVFGLPDLILDKQPNFCVVSNGADCILIDKHFYMSHTDDHLKNRLRQELCPYPTEDELQSRLQRAVDWEAYRTNIMSQAIKVAKPKRPLVLV